MPRDRTVNACRKVYAAFRTCPGVRHAAAFDGHIVLYLAACDLPPWEPAFRCDGIPVYCHAEGSIHGRRPG